MAKPRRQTYTMEMYLKNMNEQDIRSDQDVQRLSGQWNSNMINELISTVLNGDYIPPIILGEEANSQMWIIDGLQRSTGLMMFRYGNYRITSSIEEPVIAYRAKVKDAEGNVKIDGNGDIVWEDRTFDLRNKTYSRMPEELQKKFNEYQVETVIHEEYDMKQISKLVRRYNNHKAMNVAQKAFTFVDNYARRIRDILKRDFFIECTGYTKNERKNGTLERIIMESVMCMFHFDNWKKTNQVGEYINENATIEEFNILDSNLGRLENIITEDLYGLFTSRDSFIMFTLFHRFTKLNCDDNKFADFLTYFKETTKNLSMEELYGLKKENSSNKDKSVIVKKLDKLEAMMYEFLDVPDMRVDAANDILEFIRENVASYATREDVEQYTEVLNELMKKLNKPSKLLENDNKPSLVAVVAYSFEKDIDLDDWIMDYCGRHDSYLNDQKENYRQMIDDLNQFKELIHVA